MSDTISPRTIITNQGVNCDKHCRFEFGECVQTHEAPYLVRGDETPLESGMVFSNEPMLVLPGEFGVRTEDHFYMTGDGPRWFTQPPESIDDPLGMDGNA